MLRHTWRHRIWLNGFVERIGLSRRLPQTLCFLAPGFYRILVELLDIGTYQLKVILIVNVGKIEGADVTMVGSNTDDILHISRESNGR